LLAKGWKIILQKVRKTINQPVLSPPIARIDGSASETPVGAMGGSIGLPGDLPQSLRSYSGDLIISNDMTKEASGMIMAKNDCAII
jgi:hypothetical protein